MNENELLNLSLVGGRHANSILISLLLAMAIKDSEEKKILVRYFLDQMKNDWPSGLPEKYPDLPQASLDEIARAFAAQIDGVLLLAETSVKAMEDSADPAFH